MSTVRSQGHSASPAPRRPRDRRCGRRRTVVRFGVAIRRGAAWLMMLMAAAPALHASQAVQRTFTSPDAAVAALVSAVRTNDQAALRIILGSHGEKLIDSGDPVADRKARHAFVAAYERANRIEMTGDARATLVVGKDQWPMPIPLVKSNGAWHFDTQKGETEILERRIGRNELSTIQVCLAIVDAQREYATQDRIGNGVLEYARKLVSTPGSHDGLYWHSAPGQPPSPLGPLLAEAAKGGYTATDGLESEPYHGYYFRILIRQGASAPGGAYDYLVHGRLIGGFAVIAYPARYRASGVMTFIVNYDGVVYQKDLGPNTSTLAAGITSFDPDAGWKHLRLSTR